MKAALKKTLRKSDGNVTASKMSQQPPSRSIHTLARPSLIEILRYRYHHGANLGSIFVLEQWLYRSMFDANSTGSSELDAVTASIANRGVDETRVKWEAHWSSALPDDVLRWLSHTGHCTTIRLPVGYFTLGPGFCVGTSFSPQVAQVYANAWTFVRKLVARCLEYGIGVLLDFHALPGGANGESHSGTSSGKASLWNNQPDLELAVRCLCYMAQEAVGGSMDGVVGIQICNEAQWEAPGLYKFYDTVITKIGEIDPTLPVYISDAWNLDTAMRYAARRNSVKGQLSNPVIVDSHWYYTFAEKDISRSPQELIAQVPTELSEIARKEGNVFENAGACDVYVGEYSCTLSQQTWTRVPGDKRAALTRQFGQAQSRRWQQVTCGSAFWTLTMDWMPGGDWGFKEQVDNGNIIAPSNLLIPVAEVIHRGKAAERIRHECMARAVGAHESYWDEHAPDTQFEHWRFADGWELGWADARDFFLARSTGILSTGGSTTRSSKEPAAGIQNVSDGGDAIGVMELWILKRMKETGCADKERCTSGWEFEQGLRQGMGAFYTAARMQ